MAKSNGKVPTLDLYLAAYLELRGFTPEVTLQGTRAVFEFPATKEVRRLTKEYNNNPTISILDYVSIVRKLKAQMLATKAAQLRRTQ